MLKSNEERLTQMLAVLSDVQLELDGERLRRQETQSLFDLILTNMSDAVVLVDPRGRISRSNDAAARVTGLDAQDLVGRKLEDIFGPEVPLTPWQLFQRAPDGKLQSLDAQIKSADGTSVPASVSCAVIQGAHGKVVGAIYSARDLTETQQLARELDQAQARWRLLAEVNDLLGREIEPRSALPDVCHRVSEALGCTVAIVLLEDAAVRDVFMPPSAPPVAQLSSLVGRAPHSGTALSAAMESGNAVHVSVLRTDFPLLAPGAPPEALRSAAVLPLQARGSPEGAMLVFSSEEGGVQEAGVRLVQQVAPRVALALTNARLRESIAQLEASREAIRLREELIASVSHDIQTPLSVLLGWLATLNQHPDLPAAQRQEGYRSMARQAINLRRLVQQFLDYSRLEVGRPLVAQPRPTDVAVAIDKIRTDFGDRARIETDVPPGGLPEVFVDPDRLDQVLANLVSNAIKFSPVGSPVRVIARAGDEGIEVSVVDRGRGISPGEQANLFEKFYRAPGARDTEGTGLGLYTSRALVEAQGGRINVSSRVGEGSSFTVILPIAAAVDAPDR